MHKKQHIGKHGENMATKYIEALGYTIIAENFRIRFAEIDIIAYRNNLLHFIEVKTRTGTTFDPKEAVNKEKIRHILHAAQYYLLINDFPPTAWQVDVLAIIINREGALQKIDYIQNITAV